MKSDQKPKSKQGFAILDKETHAELAKKGGIAVSQDREHMSRIGKLGAKARRDKQIQKENNPQSRTEENIDVKDPLDSNN
jgi:general stress protein YciG